MAKKITRQTETVHEIKEEKFVDKIISIRARNVVVIASAVFWVITVAWSNFATPTEKANDAIALLEKQVEYQQKTIDTITKTQQNDTQEVKGNLTTLTNNVIALQNEITALKTIIDERIPKKDK